MADLSTFEKYPNSWRIDHPDFGDVSRTTFAKGVITEFKELTDDPVRLTSQVKVKMDGQESDFLPLFFHPKAKYWDDDDFLATALNEENQYFEKAWMSFQSGDEVVVMLKEGVPAAVVGFADGIPRIGENVFKITWEKWNGEQHFAHIQAAAAPGVPNRSGGWLLSPVPSNDWSEYGTLDVVPPGPDGTPLGLTREAFKLCETPWEVITTGSAQLTNWYQVEKHYQYTEYLVRLGGKLYILQLSNEYQLSTTWDAIWVGPGPGDFVKGGNLLSSSYNYSTTSFAILGAVDSKDLVESTITLGQQHSNLSPKAIGNGDYSTPPDFNDFIAYPGFTFQSGCADGFYWYLNSFRNQLFPSSWVGNNVINSSTIKIYVRPHSPAEGLI